MASTAVVSVPVASAAVPAPTMRPSSPYDPETVDNFELGMKSEWFERRLRLNAAAYFMKYNDKQEELSVPVDVEGGTGQQTLFINASKAESKGIELEVTAIPFDGFMISGSLGLLDAEYTDFDDPVTGESLTYLDLRRAPDMTADDLAVVRVVGVRRHDGRAGGLALRERLREYVLEHAAGGERFPERPRCDAELPVQQHGGRHLRAQPDGRGRLHDRPGRRSQPGLRRLVDLHRCAPAAHLWARITQKF